MTHKPCGGQMVVAGIITATGKRTSYRCEKCGVVLTKIEERVSE